jgi:cytochrome b561
MAGIILAIALLGFYMVTLPFSPDKLSLYGWHKSFGTLILFLLAIRVSIRLFGPKVENIKHHKPWEKRLSGLIHFLLYSLMALLPITGWLMSSAGDFAHSFFGLFNLPKLIGKDEVLFNQLRMAHELCVYLLFFCLFLHVLGALKHHIIDKDQTLIRMLQWAEKKLVLFLLVFGFAVYLSYIIFFYFVYFLEHSSFLKFLYPSEQTYETRHEQSVSNDEFIDNINKWTIDLAKSELSFSVMVYNEPFTSTFKSFGGDIYFDENKLEDSRAKIWIDMKSARSGSRDRDEYMRNELWFASESFPESSYVVSSFEKNNKNQYVAVGELTIKGVVLPLNLPFLLEFFENQEGNREAKVTGEIVINRLDFGVGEGEWEDTSSVKNQVNIGVSLFAKELD